MISGPVVVQVLEGDNAVAAYRDLMGATDPGEATPGTIRKRRAVSIGENSVEQPMPPIRHRRKLPNSSPAMRLPAEPGSGDFDRRISQSCAVA